MRKIDKKKNFKKVNMLVEQRYLTEKGIIEESFHAPDGTPIGVDSMHRPVTEGSMKAEYATQLFEMEKPYYNDNAALQEIIQLYQSHIQQLTSMMRNNEQN